MTKYEYKHFNEKLTIKELNELGEDGWKLVSHTAVYGQGDYSQYYVFVREKIENPTQKKWLADSLTDNQGQNTTTNY